MKCQMTVENKGSLLLNNDYYKCGKPAKYKVPIVEMNVEYVCGLHARSLDKMYERTNQSVRCQPIQVKP